MKPYWEPIGIHEKVPLKYYSCEDNQLYYYIFLEVVDAQLETKVLKEFDFIFYEMFTSFDATFVGKTF